jgi:hypothetical protein
MANFSFEDALGPRPKGFSFEEAFKPLEEEKEDESIFRSIADVPLSLGRGAVQGVRFLADTFGADNPVSNALRGTESYIGDLMSAGAKRDAKEISRIMKEAEDKGVGAQLLAALEALTVAPVDLVTQALGTAAPTILGGVAGLAVKGGLKAGATAAQIASGSKLAGQIGAGVGGAMGAGVVKSTIYDVVYEEVLKKTGSEEIAKAKAQEAQSYTGDNWDSILGGTALGTIAGITGIEKNIVGRLSAKKAAQEAGEKAAAEVVKTTAKKSIAGAGAREAIPEAAQASQEQLAGNIALQREGFDVPTFRGVAGQGALEGLLSFGLGSGVEATGRLVTPQEQQETQELKDLEKLSGQEKVVTTSEDKIAPVFDQLVDQYKAEGATEAEAFKLAGQAILVQRLDDVSKGVVDVTDTKAKPGAGAPSVSVPSGEGTISEPAPGAERVGPGGVAAVSDIPSSVGETEGAGVPSLDAAIQARANELIAEAADLGATIPMDVAIERATTELTETIEPDVTSEVITATPTETTTAELATTPATTAPATAASPQTETTPLKFGLASSIVETPKVGFKTEKGSVYSLDEQNKTSRTKMSEGEGKGTTYDPHAVLYVSPEDAKSVLSDMQSGALDKSASVRLGYVDTKNNVFKSVKDVSEIPAEAEPLVATVDKKKNQVITFYKAKLNPAIGLSPIEKLYTPDGMANTHIGNKIVELFGQTESTTTPSSTPAETTTTTPAENIVETPATDPVGFARVQALTSFENRNSSDYSNPEEAIDFGLDNLNDTLTEYKVTDPYIREQAVEAYKNEIARLEKGAATVSVDQATTAAPAETKLKPQGKPRGRKPVVRTPEEQAEAEAQRKQRQAIGRDAIREADKAQAVITREFNLDDYATEDAAKASALELLQERQGALVAAYNTMANKSLAPNSKAKQTAQAVINHESVTDKERRDAKARIAATEQTTARSDLLTGATNQDLDATYLVEDFGTATKAIEYIMRTGSAFEKLLSQRIKPFLKGVKLVIVNIIAAANKVAKQNKTLNKIYRSQSASKIASSIGQLFVETRSVKDALRLLKSVYGALKVGSIRTILPTLTTMDITRLVGDDIANLKTVNQTVTDMAGMRAKMIRELAEKTPEWIEFNRKYEQGGIALGDVMNASTLLSVDPSANPDVATALQNDVQLKQLNTEYQAALNDPAKTPKQRSAAKARVTKRENDIKVVYEGGTVTNPDTNESYTMEGWDKLGKYDKGKGHEIYKMAKDTYENTFNQHLKLLTDKINKSNIPGTASNPNTPKGKLIAEITKNFQEAMKMGVYFPLMRYGNYWLRIGKGKSGEFYMFESATARNYYAAKRAEESGKTLDEMVESQEFDVGDDLRDLRKEFEDSSQMLKDIFKALEDSSQVDPNTGKAGISDVDALKDQVYQMYLMTLPERDIRRKFTHRQGKTGFSADVIRNFIVSQHTAANQLSRLAYSDKLRLAIGSAYAELAGNPDRLKLSAFVDEIAMRAAAEMSPAAPGEFNWDSVASVANQAVFYYMLTSPKSALVQMTQLPVVGLPVLSAEYGVGKATATALRYSNLFNKLGTTKKDKNGDVITEWGQPSINDSGYVNKHPDPAYRAVLKRAWEAGQDKDLYGATFASDMTARAKVPTQRYQGGAMRVLRWTGNLMGGSFHHMERITREIMYMSSFELEYARQIKQGAKPADAEKAAVNKAVDLVYESLFNYTQYNKPRLMKAGAIPKIATQFMTYPLQMTSYLVRNFIGMLPFLNKSQKKEAAIQFFGTIGMTGMFAGVVGLPGYSMIMGMAEGVREALRPDMEDEDADEYYDDDDEGNPLGKRNLDLWFREWFIPTYFGPNSDLASAMGLTEEQALTLQRAVKLGPISAFTDLNIGSSVSLNNLFFDNDVPAENSKEALEQFAFSTMTGPFGSMATSLAGAYDDFNNGDLVRGFEKLSPAFFRGAFTTYRLSQEGLQTRQGAEIKDAEFYTTGKLVGQALGFQSTTVAEIQKSNFTAKQMVLDIQKERNKVLEKLDKAFQKFDNNPSDANEEAIDDILVEIDRYNYKNGMIPITNETIERSLEGRAKRREMADYGLILGEKEAAFVYPMLEKTRPLQ